MEKHDEKYIKDDFSMYEEWRTYPPVPNMHIVHQENNSNNSDNNAIGDDIPDGKG